MFESREKACLLLLPKLEKIVDSNTIVAPLIRGAVSMGKIISIYFNIPLWPLIVKKIALPQNPELAVGAIASLNTVYWNKELLKELNISKNEKKEILKIKREEFREKEKLLEKFKKSARIRGSKILVVDDGVATGASVIAVAKYLKKEAATKIILVTPVISKDTLSNIKNDFDSIITLKKASNFYAVGEFYKDFPQVSDKEVINILSK